MKGCVGIARAAPGEANSLDSSTVTEYRAHFDAEVEFANGGRLTAERFRLDLPGPDLSEDQVAQLFVRNLGLALVAAVELRSFDIGAEPHKGSRGVAAQPTTERRASWWIEPHHLGRTDHLSRYPGTHDHPHLTRGSPAPLRGGHRVCNRRDHAGRQHQHLSGQSLPPLPVRCRSC